jgi:release factor glutamine methyltransferase
LLRLPGVYRPQADTRLLLEALRDVRPCQGARVLDMCTGSGIAAIAAARSGASEVTAVDAYLPAVLSARTNTWVRLLAVRVRVRRGDLSRRIEGAPFDLVLANPPYVPCPSVGVSRGAAVAWDAGPDGRRCVEKLCDKAFDLLVPAGTMLLVHSALCGVQRTLESLREKGLKSSVVARATEPFGPVMRRRAEYLEGAGLIERGDRQEELVVIRADRIER